MSKTLTLELPEELWETFEKMAVKYGKTTEQLALEYLARSTPKPRPKLTEQEFEEAKARLRRHAGAGNSGDPRSADNERIDADLAREYGSSHEDD